MCSVPAGESAGMILRDRSFLLQKEGGGAVFTGSVLLRRDIYWCRILPRGGSVLRKCGAPENTPKTSRKCMKQSFTNFTSFHFHVV